MDFYSYELSIEDGDSYRYVFYTELQLTYIVALYPSEQYNPKVADFKYLYTKSKALLLVCADDPTPKGNKGGKFGCTVCTIIHDFLKNEQPDFSLIFHCDDEDGKHAARSRLFDQWKKNHTEEFDIEMKCIEIDLTDENGGVKKTYLGIINNSDLEYKDELYEEFKELSTQLTASGK